ncbi:hypothetical protein MW887_000971 [Aspergillus wentii]|nr:hypothetical protein MW887_000971 [Aspergillus wentii]
MAEALGVAASAISLLAVVEQIVHSINRLRDLHTFMKTAPDELQNLIEDIETVQEILLSLKPEMLKFLNISSAERRLLRFQKDLDMLILTIQKYIKSAVNRIGALKLALNKEALDKKRQNLENVRSTLLLVQQAYCSASLYEIHARISAPVAVKEKKPRNEETSMGWPYKREYKHRLQYNSGYRQYCGDELFDDDPVTQASGFQAPPEVLAMIQGHFFEDYSKLPLEFRFKQATSLLHTPFSHPNADIIRVAMGGGSIDPAAYSLENEGETLLHRIVRGLALVIIQKRASYIAGWRRLFADAVAAGADLCYVSSRFSLTPLMLFLSYFTQPWCIPTKNYVNTILEIWLSELLLAGIDLAIYGANEKALHTSGAARTSLSVFNNGDEIWFRLFLLKYGAKLEDWNILSTDPVDSLVGQFWEMVERAEERMPGAWL